MEDFFDQIKSNLENREEPSFEEKDWTDLSARLNQSEQSRKPFLWFLWSLLPLLLLLFGSNWHWGAKLKHTNKRISQIERQTDTIYKTRVIVQTDTIYVHTVQTQYIYQPISDSYNRFVARQPSFDFKPTLFQEKETLSKLLLTRRFTTINDLAIVNQSQSTMKNAHLDKALELLPSIAWNMNSSRQHSIQPFINQLDSDVKKNNRSLRRGISKLAEAVKPKSYELGIEGGTNYPLLGQTDVAFGYSSGLNFIATLSDQIQLQSNISVQGMSYESVTMGEKVGIPIVAPPQNDLAFVKVDVPLQAFQTNIGLRYNFLQQSKIQPHIALNYGIVYHWNSDLLYEFKNTTTGLEWLFEQVSSTKGWSANYWTISGGIDFSISKRLDLNFNGGYRTRTANKGYTPPALFNLSTGLRYKF